MEIGSKIKQLRCRASLTQEQLADKLGLSAQAVSKWENSATMPDISLLPELAQIFGTSIDELFDLTTEQKIRRIENRMDIQDDLEEDVFREYESFLKEKISDSDTKQRITSVLAYLIIIVWNRMQERRRIMRATLYRWNRRKRTASGSCRKRREALPGIGILQTIAERSSFTKN